MENCSSYCPENPLLVLLLTWKEAIIYRLHLFPIYLLFVLQHDAADDEDWASIDLGLVEP